MQQLPLAEAGQLLLVIAVSFGLITLIASSSRFHRMIQLSEEELTSVEDFNDFFFVQVTRYLSKINRVSSGFGVLVIQFETQQTNLRPVQEQLLGLLKGLIREECDKACLFHENCVTAIIDTEEENVPPLSKRIAKELAESIQTIPAITAFRLGSSSFPMHGLTSQAMIDSTAQAMESAQFDDPCPVFITPPPETEDEEPETEEIGELSKEDKNSAIDSLTGVLKPEVIGSYMRKYLSEIRQKKKPAALLCVGINRIDDIGHLHGEAAADATIAEVSKVIQLLTRDSDLIGRYHRDDFLVLAPCSLEQGKMIAIRVREAVQSEVLLFDGKRIKTSISAGISGHPEHGRTLRDLFRGSYAALETVRDWNTTSCLVYDPNQHDKKARYEQTS